MKKIILFILVVFLIQFVSPICEKGQIDINSASLEELDELHGIGPVRAQAIIDYRPFKSLDDLINVSGIGPRTLEKIKFQGLACVGVTEEEKQIPIEEQLFIVEEPISIRETISIEYNEKQKNNTELRGKREVKQRLSNGVPREFYEEKTSINREPIHLNPKDIKTENSNEEVRKRDYSKYLIFLFCLILAGLYLINLKNEKRKEKTRKTEWR